MFPLPPLLPWEEPPVTFDDWMLMGIATRADGMSPPLDPPPDALAGFMEPKGKSPMKLENRGGRLLSMLGVLSDMMGVLRDSAMEVVATCELEAVVVTAVGC